MTHQNIKYGCKSFSGSEDMRCKNIALAGSEDMRCKNILVRIQTLSSYGLDLQVQTATQAFHVIGNLEPILTKVGCKRFRSSECTGQSFNLWKL